MTSNINKNDTLGRKSKEKESKKKGKKKGLTKEDIGTPTDFRYSNYIIMQKKEKNCFEFFEYTYH